MKRARDSYCSYCGTQFAEPLLYPRTCRGCGAQIWANPLPVTVVLAQIIDGERTGLLVVRRAIRPQIAKLALVGGFLEAHETWQQGGAREVREEAGVTIDPAQLEPHWFASSEPTPDRVMLFSLAPPLPASALPSFTPNGEASERGIIYGPGGLDGVFAFSTHVEAARRYFAARGVIAPHGFSAR